MAVWEAEQQDSHCSLSNGSAPPVSRCEERKGGGKERVGEKVNMCVCVCIGEKTITQVYMVWSGLVWSGAIDKAAAKNRVERTGRDGHHIKAPPSGPHLQLTWNLQATGADRPT